MGYNNCTCREGFRLSANFSQCLINVIVNMQLYVKTIGTILIHEMIPLNYHNKLLGYNLIMFIL